jgi:hypothetical protein
MGFAPHTVTFLARASRAIGVLTLVAWLIDCIVLLNSGSGPASAKTGELLILLLPTVPLYALPGLILLICSKSVDNGRPAAVAIIFIISILSLFKLVLLAGSFEGPYFDMPLYLELPVRGFFTLLSVACAYAWPDLMDMKRMRSSPPRGNSMQPKPFPPRPVPPPSGQLPRLRPKRDDPPASQTPWF